jgi:hypothetical protein
MRPTASARAVNMLCCGDSPTDIKNRLGHENINATMVYLHMDLTHKRAVQKKFIQYAQSTLKHGTNVTLLGKPKLITLPDGNYNSNSCKIL